MTESFKSPINTESIVADPLYVLASATIDTTSSSAQLLFSPPGGGRIAMPLRFVCRNMTGSVTGTFMWTIGDNSPNYDNIAGAQSLNLTNFGTGFFDFNPIDFASDDQNPYYLKATDVFIGTSSMIVDVIGYLV